MKKEKLVQDLMSLTPATRIAVLLAVKERRELKAQELAESQQQSKPEQKTS